MNTLRRAYDDKPLKPVSRLTGLGHIFIGDQESLSSYEFINQNKITRIINCAGTHCMNQFAGEGVVYLTFYLLDMDNSLFLDESNNYSNLFKLVEFLDKGEQNCENILIGSVLGKSRSMLVTASYLMYKYRLSAQIAIDICSQSRRTRMRSAFEAQLKDFESKNMYQKLTPELAISEFAMRNTHFNRIFRIDTSVQSSSTGLKIQIHDSIRDITVYKENIEVINQQTEKEDEEQSSEILKPIRQITPGPQAKNILKWRSCSPFIGG
ncbi:MAG: hypothetical protein EZS28_023207 [Streblomastix strix]|uniref:Tyrosine-protein phosphatase domain-containing protein n=1 Tax=Streblomastix strix TaxID=222440 RepID=A0A5J4VFR6_9EUKA|nr:MAG: hypothetical protein EZS28_023207 [Streblomastix strix]